MYAFKLLEAKGEIELDIGSSIGIMSKLLMVVETIIFSAHAKIDMPLHPLLLPFLKELHLGAWLAEKFHLHLLELSHPKDELPCHNLVSEGLAYLRDTERYLHTSSLLDI